jgi:PAS domain S-box-containing protein
VTAVSEVKLAHYMRTVDDSPLGMFRVDSEGRIMDANKRLLDLLGYEWAELRGKGFNDITHPDDRWIGLEVLLDLRAGRVDNAAYEKRFLTRTGRSVWAGVTASAITVNGVLTGVVVMVTDLSVRRLTDPIPDTELEMLRKALAVAPIILFACDRDGLLTLCEHQGINSSSKTEDLIGRPVWDVYEDKTAVREHMQRGLLGETGEFAMRFGGVQFNCRYRPIEAVDGSILGVSGLAQDVTALTSVTRENVRLTEFMNTLSHELRSPLNAILGFTELLVNGNYGPVSDRQKRPLGQIDIGGRHLLSLINDILDLAKVKAGHLHLDEADIEAGTMIHALATEMGPAALLKGVRLVDAAGPTFSFKADRRRVHQVLLNLLSNAIKFTPVGGTVELALSADAGGGPRICVSDTGTGLAPDDLRMIFEEYGQVEAQRAGNPEGTGLGLPISRKLATLMGGTLVAESTLGVGSRFCLTLPRVRAIAG